MRRRRLLLTVGAVALLGVAGFAMFIWLISPTPGVTLENFRRLLEGMSTTDVEALLGEPSKVRESLRGTTRCWQGEEVGIDLLFDADRVLFGIAVPPQPPGRFGLAEYIRVDESFLDRIRRWLHW